MTNGIKDEPKEGVYIGPAPTAEHPRAALPPDPFEEGRRSIEIADAVIEDDPKYSEIPGSQYLDSLGAKPDKPVTLPSTEVIVRISIEQATIHDLQRTVGAYGDIVFIPPQSGNRADCFVRFESREYAAHAIAATVEEFPDWVSVGMRRSGEIRAIAQTGATGIYLYGPGIEEAKKITKTEKIPSVRGVPPRNLPIADEKASEILRALHKPLPCNGVGAVALIESPRLYDEENGDPREVVAALQSIMQPRTERIAAIGNSLYLFSTREGAFGYLAVVLTKLEKILAEKKIPFRTTIDNSGRISTLNAAIPGAPKVLSSPAIRVVDGLAEVSDPTDGVYVSEDGLRHLRRTPREGVLITAAEHKEGDAVERARILEIEQTTYEAITGGPRKMVGREQEFAQATGSIEHVYAKNAPAVLIVEGEPGIGKSRLLSELKRYAQDTTEMHAQFSRCLNEEQQKPFSFIRRVVTQLCDTARSSGNSTEMLRYLNAFVGGAPLREGEPVEGYEIVMSMQANPQLLVLSLAQGLKDMGSRSLIELDDLQWCDTQSAKVIAMYIAQLSGDEKITLVLSSRSRENEIPMVIRMAYDRLEKKHGKNVYAKKIELRGLKFMETPSVGDGARPTAILRDFIMNMLPVQEDVEIEIPQSVLQRFGDFVDGQADLSGNPLFLEHLVRGMFDEKKLEITNNVLRFADPNIDSYFTKLTYDSVIENRFVRLAERYPHLITTVQHILLFPKGITPDLFDALYPGDLQLADHLQELGLVQTSGGKVGFLHGKIQEAAAAFCADARSPQNAYAAYSRLQLIKIARIADEIDPQLEFELLRLCYDQIAPGQPFVEGFESRELQSTIAREALERGLVSAQKLNSWFQGHAADEILDWIKAQVLNFGSDEQRLEVAIQRTIASQIIGQYDKTIESAREAIELLPAFMPPPNATATKKQHHWRREASIYLALSTAGVNDNRVDVIKNASGVLKKHCTRAPREVGKDVTYVYEKRSQILDALARYFEAAKLELAQGLPLLNESQQELGAVIADMKKTMSTMETQGEEVPAEMEQTLAEAERRIAQITIYKERMRRKNVAGNEDASRLLPPISDPATRREIGAAIRALKDLLQHAETNPHLFPEGHALARMHVFYAQAIIMSTRDPDQIKEALAHFDEARNLSRFWSDQFAWNSREMGDWGSAVMMSPPYSKMTEADFKTFFSAYDEAITELRALAVDDSDRRIPNHNRFPATGCNLGRLVAKYGEQPDELHEDMLPFLRKAWDAVMSALIMHTGTFNKEKQQFRFDHALLQDEGRRKDIFEDLLTNLGHLSQLMARLKTAHPYSEADIPTNDADWLKEYIGDSGSLATAHLREMISGLDDSIRDAEADHQDAKVAELGAAQKELQWKYLGAVAFQEILR